MANNSANCSNSSKWNHAEVDDARASLALASAILCVAAVVLLVYSKLYRSFHYRLILYLLIANIINCLFDALQMLFFRHDNESSLSQAQKCFCYALSYLEVYTSWNLLLTVSFIIVEIFTMINYSYTLVKLEIPCAVACFGLPCFVSVVPFITGSFALVDHYCGLRQYKDGNCSDHDSIEKYIWFIPGLVVALMNVTLIIAAVLRLAYKLHQMKSLNTQTTVLVLVIFVYPIAVLVLVIIESLHRMDSNSHAIFILNCIFHVLLGCMGAIIAGIFFIHYLVRLKRSAKQPAVERGDQTGAINVRTSTTGHGPSYYTAEDNYSEGSKWQCVF